MKGENNMENIKEKVRQYLIRLVGNYDLKDDEDIFEIGLVHSLFSIQLLLFIEKEFGIEIDDEELNFDNLRTVNSIVSLVQSRIN